jgi:O-antigen/teichoic acid export membrane protein
MAIKLFQKKEVNNAGWLIGGRMLQMVLSLFVGLLTARYLGPSNYGLINYASTYIAFFSSFCTLGINSVIVKNFIDKPEEEGATIGSTLLLRSVCSLLSAVTIIAVSTIVDKDNPTTIIVVALCSLALPFQVFDTINYWFQAQYKSKITSIATLVAYVVTSVYKIVLLILGKSVVWFAVASSVDYVCIAIFLIFAYFKHKGPKFTFSKSKSKELLSASCHYILSGMMVAVYGHTDKFMLNHMIGETAVGYYSVAVAICSMWTFVLSAIIDSVVPTILRLHGESEEEFDRKNRQLYAIVFYISVIVSLIFLVFGDYIVLLLYGKEFLPASPVLKIVTWYTAFSFLGVARNPWIVSKGQQKYLVYIYVIAAIMNVILNFALIPILGEFGAGLASLITQISTSIVIPYFIKGMRKNAKLMINGILLKDIGLFTSKKNK